MNACPGCGQNGNQDGLSPGGDVIAVAVRHFLDEPMRSQHAELPADSRRAAVLLLCPFRPFVIKPSLLNAVAQNLYQKTSPPDGPAHCLNLRPTTHSPPTP